MSRRAHRMSRRARRIWNVVGALAAAAFTALVIASPILFELGGIG